jgi:hypothetical protein
MRVLVKATSGRNAMINKDIKHFVRGMAIFLSLTVVLPVFADGQTEVSEQPSRLVVSFYSICCGIDQKAKAKLDTYISNYEKARGKQLKKTEAHWGREGEVDYCFKLAELSPGERKRFISKVKSLLKRSKLVHINKNAPCSNAR